MKISKIIISLCLIAAMAVTFIGCGNSKPAEGTYVCVRFENENGETISDFTQDGAAKEMAKALLTTKLSYVEGKSNEITISFFGFPTTLVKDGNVYSNDSYTLTWDKDYMYLVSTSDDTSVSVYQLSDE